MPQKEEFHPNSIHSIPKEAVEASVPAEEMHSNVNAFKADIPLVDEVEVGRRFPQISETLIAKLVACDNQTVRFTITGTDPNYRIRNVFKAPQPFVGIECFYRDTGWSADMRDKEPIKLGISYKIIISHVHVNYPETARREDGAKVWKRDKLQNVLCLQIGDSKEGIMIAVL